MLMSERHNKDLYYKGKDIIAPRCFYDFSFIYYIHIAKNCDSVVLWLDITHTALSKCKHNVVYYRTYKLYSNTKGLYFNFRNYYNSVERVYICD